MKQLFLLIILSSAFAITQLSAQIRKVPAEVTDAFKAKYPEAKNVEWKDNLTNFQASFTLDGADWTAEFTGKGEWKESTKKLSFEALPGAVKEGFSKSKYNDWSPGSVTLIEQSDNSTLYKIYVEKSSIVQKRFLFFNKDGQLEKDTPGI